MDGRLTTKSDQRKARQSGGYKQYFKGAREARSGSTPGVIVGEKKQ